MKIMTQFSIRFHQLALLLIGMTLLISSCQKTKNEDENPLSKEEQESAKVRPEITFAVADDKPLYQYIESQGVVRANQTAKLKPKISGYITHSYIAEGKSVNKGDTLLAFDRREQKMEVRQAMNEYEKSKNKYRIEMGMRAGRSTANGDSETHTKQNSNKSGGKLVRITTGLAQAEVKLKRAKLDLSYTVLTAPFGGTLSTDNRLSGGTYVSAGQQVGQLVDDQKVRIRFDVLESELSRVEAGMDVRLTVPGGQQLEGRVQAVAPVVKTKTKTATVVVEAPNSKHILSPGMTVEGRIQVLKQDGKARIPRSAILSRDGRTLLFKLAPKNNEVNWVYVEPTAQNSEWAIVDHKNVAPGDTIAVDHNFSLSHLQSVEPKMEVQGDK